MSELSPEQYIELLREKINGTKAPKFSKKSISKSESNQESKLVIKPVSKPDSKPKTAPVQNQNNMNLKKYAKNILIAGIILKTASSIYSSTKDS